MNRFSNSKLAVSNMIFGAAVALLIVVAGVGFGLYALSSTNTTTSIQTVTVTTTSAEMMTNHTTTSEQMMNHTSTSMAGENSTSSGGAFMFTAKSGAMISNAWLITVPVNMHQYAVSIHAEGLEPNGTYIVEGALSSGSMQVVPISSQSMNMNTTSASEFQANKNGTGVYWIVLDSNPATAFESIELLYLPGMSMQNATVVATVTFGHMMTTTSTHSMSS